MKIVRLKAAYAINVLFISKHISGAEDDWTFEHWQKYDG